MNVYFYISLGSIIGVVLSIIIYIIKSSMSVGKNWENVRINRIRLDKISSEYVKKEMCELRSKFIKHEIESIKTRVTSIDRKVDKILSYNGIGGKDD